MNIKREKLNSGFNNSPASILPGSLDARKGYPPTFAFYE